MSHRLRNPSCGRQSCSRFAATHLTGPALVLSALLFYLVTLAPTVLWGDDAHFQRTAYEGTLRHDGGGHWLWLQIARLFVRLPWGDVAYRVNLLSAVAAAGTLLVLYGAGRALGLGTGGATAAAASLAVAHGFWMHAERAEVYTAFTLLLATQLWLWFNWRPQRNWPLFVASALIGTTLLAHQMGLLLLPAFAFLVWRRRTWLGRTHALVLGATVVLGLLPFFLVVHRQIGVVADATFAVSLSRYFTWSGVDFGGRMFDFSFGMLPRDGAMWLGFLAFQFVGMAGLLGLRGAAPIGRSRPPTAWLALAILFATDVAFAFSYRVNDQFVFYLPSYLVFALCVGYGWQEVVSSRARRWPVRALLMTLLICGPIVTYEIAARFLVAVDANPLGVRELPGREPNRFFIWPGKSGYFGAEAYGRGALEVLPPDAILLADHTPFETLRYLQSVEGVRRDVGLIKIEPGQDLALVTSSLPEGSAVFLADNNPDYYNLTNLPEVRLKRTHPVYRVLVPGES